MCIIALSFANIGELAMRLLLLIAVDAVKFMIDVLWGGFVIKILWSWFIVTTFGLPELSIVAAAGLALVVALVTSKTTTNFPKDDDEQVKLIIAAYIHSVLVPAFALLFGWVLHFWM